MSVMDLVVGDILDFLYVEQVGQGVPWSEILIQGVTSTGFSFTFVGEREDTFRVHRGDDALYWAYGSQVLIRPAERWPSRLLDELGVGSEAWIKTTLGSI